MVTSRAFRLSLYLTLGIACVALGHAIFPVFPEVGVFAGVAVISLAVTYRLESRVRLLSIPDANLLGGGIALTVALWAAYRIIRELRTGESADLGWTLFGVALMAPLLMAAMPAKLLRREKHAGDYWQLHAAALGAMVLAGAVDETPFTFIATAAYVGCAVWSLAEFYLAQAEGTVPPIPPRSKEPKPKQGDRRGPVRVVAASGHRLPGIARAAALTAAAAVLAAPLYLAMPRSSFGKQEFGRPRIEIGYAADQMVNLNRAGKLETNHEVAFVVEARQDNQPKTDLSPEQRWRGNTLVRYRQGTWQQERMTGLPQVARRPRSPQVWTPPDLGPGQFELRFTVPTDLRAEFLADPVIWKGGDTVPVANILPGGVFQSWFVLSDGSIVQQPGPTALDTNKQYIQVYRLLADTSLGPGFMRSDPRPTWIDPELISSPVPAVEEYGSRTLERLVQMKKLPPAVLDRERIHLHVLPEYHEMVARAFEDYLSNEAGLTYTTNLRRVDREADPVEDFLLNSRSGHCERFASALVLLLRSQGIPAVAVLGFKGCEHTGNGRYEVRHEHAHVWAEALISRPDGNGGRVWHWLSLDPSPRDEAIDPAADQTGGVLNRATAWSREKLDRYLIRYTPEERKRALASATDFLTSPGFLSAVGVVAAVGILILAVRRRRRPSISMRESAWLDRLLGVLAAGGFVPTPGQTPREFAAAVADELEQRPQTASVAAVPGEWVETYYRLRFGGSPPSEVVQAQLDIRLEELRGALTGA